MAGVDFASFGVLEEEAVAVVAGDHRDAVLVPKEWRNCLLQYRSMFGFLQSRRRRRPMQSVEVAGVLDKCSSTDRPTSIDRLVLGQSQES